MRTSSTASRHRITLAAFAVGSFSALALSLTLAAPAHAALGDSGITISAERLFGYANTHTETGAGAGTVNGSRNAFALFLAPPTSIAMYNAPRIALDVSIQNGLTVGGSFGLVAGGTSSGFTGGGVTVSTDTDQTIFVLSPRAGYALALNDKFTLWGRGGITYFSSADNGNTDRTISGLALTIEPTFVFKLASNIGLTLGLTLDLPLTGEIKQELPNGTTTTIDTTYRQIGLLFGLALDLF
jgi:opacity protein-like surface antigen